MANKLNFEIGSFFKFSKKFEKNLPKINLIFVFIFLNIWDFLTSRELINAMVLGFAMFAPAIFLWFVGNIKAIALLTLISIFEFMVMLVFVLEGFESGGAQPATKSLFWVPYLLMVGVNGFWGLKIYSEHREKKEKGKK